MSGAPSSLKALTTSHFVFMAARELSTIIKNKRNTFARNTIILETRLLDLSKVFTLINLSIYNVVTLNTVNHQMLSFKGSL